MKSLERWKLPFPWDSMLPDPSSTNTKLNFCVTQAVEKMFFFLNSSETDKFFFHSNTASDVNISNDIEIDMDSDSGVTMLLILTLESTQCFFLNSSETDKFFFYFDTASDVNISNDIEIDMDSDSGVTMLLILTLESTLMKVDPNIDMITALYRH